MRPLGIYRRADEVVGHTIEDGRALCTGHPLLIKELQESALTLHPVFLSDDTNGVTCDVCHHPLD